MSDVVSLAEERRKRQLIEKPHKIKRQRHTTAKKMLSDVKQINTSKHFNGYVICAWNSETQDSCTVYNNVDSSFPLELVPEYVKRLLIDSMQQKQLIDMLDPEGREDQ